jgi:hypothetical protein
MAAEPIVTTEAWINLDHAVVIADVPVQEKVGWKVTTKVTEE